MLRRLLTLTNITIALFFFSVFAWAGSMTVQPSTADNYLDFNNNTTNYGTQTYLYVGDNFYVGADRPYRSILKFNFSSLPVGATITNAQLYLYYYSASGTVSGRTYSVYRLTQTGWTETGSSWKNYKSGSAWTTAGGDYTATGVSSATMPGSYGWVNWNVTAQVQYAQASVLDVAHFIIKDANESIGLIIYALFYSNNYTTDPTLCPYLVITFTPAGGGGSQTLFFSNG